MIDSESRHNSGSGAERCCGTDGLSLVLKGLYDLRVRKELLLYPFQDGAIKCTGRRDRCELSQEPDCPFEFWLKEFPFDQSLSQVIDVVCCRAHKHIAELSASVVSLLSEKKGKRLERNSRVSSAVYVGDDQTALHAIKSNCALQS